MKYLLMAVAAAGLLALTGPAGAEDSKKADDQKAIQGTWKVEKLEQSDGHVPPEDVIQKTHFVFAGHTMTIDMGERKHRGKFKLMSDKKPKRIDITPEDGQEAGKTFAGIYELTGDTLKLCVAHGETPPTEFAAKGDKVILVVLKRAKK